MKSILPVIFTLVFLLSCSKTQKDPVIPDENPLHTGQIRSLHHFFSPKDTFAIYHYLDTIAYHITDSIRAIQLAQQDAANGAYFFMNFGMPAPVQPFSPGIYSEQKNICKKNNIWIFNMGCEDSEIGRIYTREMKKLLKENKGLTYDSIFNPELVSF